MNEYKVTAIVQVKGELSLIEKDFESLDFDPSAEVQKMMRKIDGAIIIANIITVWRMGQMGNWLPEFIRR